MFFVICFAVPVNKLCIESITVIRTNRSMEVSLILRIELQNYVQAFPVESQRVPNYGHSTGTSPQTPSSAGEVSGTLARPCAGSSASTVSNQLDRLLTQTEWIEVTLRDLTENQRQPAFSRSKQPKELGVGSWYN